MTSQPVAARAAATFAVVVLGACDRGASAPPRGHAAVRTDARDTSPAASARPVDAAAPDAAVRDPIAWQLIAEPQTVTMAQRGTFRLWIAARNTGSAPADTRRDALRYVVNGQESMSLGMAFGNGSREPAWHALAPGERLREARAMGPSLFPAPGRYRIELKRDGSTVADVTVEVVADP